MSIPDGLSASYAPLDKALQQIETWQSAGEQIVFTNGCFDLIHVGHVRCLQNAKRLGTRLVIGLNTDRSVRHLKGGQRPVQPEWARAEVLMALSCVDLVILFDEATPEKLIEQVRPQVLAKGGDWQEDQIAGAKFVKSIGGQVALIPFVDGFSTTETLSKLRDLE
ncbi:MAG: D-glycero-beta-D-manno-heptose 1-phosphate adenylyltransferase [Candidatus Omnitrophica bacterium]|nr:D-glycero-beta-D-manno-heptose 1-phosphate adenylyltransferase [Candidatus Omnitrophota bacterium]